MGRKRGKMNWKSQALQPTKTQKFKPKKVLHQEDPRSPSPQPPAPPSRPPAGSDLKTKNPFLYIVLSADDTDVLKPEAFVEMVPISSLPSCPTTPSDLSIVSYEAPLSSRTRSTWKTKKYRTLGNHWNRKKLATLLNHFNPIPFVRERPSNVAAHQLLLTRLGLWSFLHLDFDRNIHSDLIKQLVIYYNPKKPWHRRSHVNGCPILLSRAEMARALALPTKRLNVDGNDARRARPFIVSEEESLFVEELVCSWLVLQDDDCELPGEVMKVRRLIRERRLEHVDWAGLIWFMVKSELLKGKKLVNCYYASHMQLLLKNQKPRFFGDHVKIAGILDTGAAVCDEENVDKSLSGLEGPEMVNRGIGLFNDESEKESFLDVEQNAVGVEESGREQKMETTLQRCHKINSSFEQCMGGSNFNGKINTSDFIAADVDDCKGYKLQDPQATVIPFPGKVEIELNTTCEVHDHNVVELRCREEEDVTFNDFGCKETDYQQGESNCLEDENGEDHELNSANGMLMNGDIDEGQKIECSSDLTTGGMHILNKQEADIQQMDLVSSQEKGETKFGLNLLTQNKKVIDEKFCIPEQQSAMEKEDGNSELRLLRVEDENELSGVATEDLFVGKSGELPDGPETKFSIDFECNEMECQQGESTDLEFSSAIDMLMNEDCNDEGLKIECSSDFPTSEMHILSRQESEFEQMDLVLSQDKGEKEFALYSLVKDCKIISEKFCILDEQHAVQMQDGNGELRLLAGEDESKLSKGLTKAEVHAVKMQDGNREMKLLHGEDEIKLSEGLVKEEIFDSRTGELLDSREKEVNNDSECNQMDHQQLQSNWLQDKYGKELESGSASGMLTNEDSNKEGLKIECSSDLTMDGMHSLSRQDTDFQQMELVLSQDKGETEFGLNVLVEEHNVIDGNFLTSDEQRAIEIEDGNGELRLQNELSVGLVEDENFDGKTGELLDSQEKKVGNIFISTEQHDIKMEDGDRESRLVHGKHENEFSEGFIKEELCDAKAGELLDNQEEEVRFRAENSIMDGENQQTEIAMEEEKPELLGIHDSLVEGEEIVKPEASGLDEFLGAEKDLQMKKDLQKKNAVKIEPFVEPFASEREICMNLADSPFDNSLKREIDCLNDSQFERRNETQKITGINSAAGESFDLDLCSGQAELWMSRLKSAAHKRAQMDNEVNAMLLKELEEKNRIIEHYEKIRCQEQHKRQKDMLRYERELYLMKSVLVEYQTALDQLHKSFALYRKRAQLPEEPLYIDHPDGGGKVILAAELESSKLKKERENL